MQAKDKDRGIGSAINYRLKSGNSSLFNVSKSGGVSTKALWINKTNRGRYTFVIEAFNDKRFKFYQLKSCTQTITVYIQVSLRTIYEAFKEIFLKVVVKVSCNSAVTCTWSWSPPCRLLQSMKGGPTPLIPVAAFTHERYFFNFYINREGFPAIPVNV